MKELLIKITIMYVLSFPSEYLSSYMSGNEPTFLGAFTIFISGSFLLCVIQSFKK